MGQYKTNISLIWLAIWHVAHIPSAMQEMHLVFCVVFGTKWLSALQKSSRGYDEQEQLQILPAAINHFG